MKKFIRFAAATLVFTGAAVAQQVTVDPSLKLYKPVDGVSGNLNSIGSDTLNNLMTFWAEGFRKNYPNVVVQVEGKGSSTAPPALIEGTAQFGPMSRPMKDEEIEQFEKKYKFKPTEIGVALDSLAVFVHKDNPVKALSLAQVDAIFSRTRKGGGSADINIWGDAGVAENGYSALPISLFGRNSASGTYGFFKEHALAKGDFKDTVKEQPGSASVVMGVSADRAGIGYSGIGYKTSGVRTVPLSMKDGEPAYEANMENVLTGKYPLSRMLYIYIAKKPGEPADPAVAEFIKYILSKEGQETTIKDGFYPLPATVVEEQLKKLD